MEVSLCINKRCAQEIYSQAPQMDTVMCPLVSILTRFHSVYYKLKTIMGTDKGRDLPHSPIATTVNSFPLVHASTSKLQLFG